MKFSNLKRQEVRKEIVVKGGDNILIYNPTVQQRNNVIDMFINRMDKQTGDIKITDEDVLCTLIPMLTNIDLDLDKNNDKDLTEIKSIINDPSDILLEVSDELNIMLQEITKRVVKKAKEFSELTEDERLELKKQNIKISKENSDKMKKLEELKKQQEELEKEIKSIK